MKGYPNFYEPLKEGEKQPRCGRVAQEGEKSVMMSFRIYPQNVKFLRHVNNKGGLINQLLEEECRRRTEAARSESPGV